MRGSPSLFQHMGSSHRLTLTGAVLLSFLLLATVFLVTDHGDFSLSFRAAPPSPSYSAPPPLTDAPRGGSLTRHMPVYVADSPAPASLPGLAIDSTSSVKREEPDSDLGRIELSLSRARAWIKDANRSTTIPDPDYVPSGPLYWNANAFHRSYLEMEKTFKVYVYGEGEPPIFHDGPCKSIYSTEGRFIYNMETDTRIRTKDAREAHVHFLPFSIGKMIRFLRDPTSYDIRPIKNTIEDYINLISHRYPFWNRSLGSDHFMISCHDWAPESSAAVRELYTNSIRILCNANTSEGFNPSKDVSLPEMNLRTDDTTEIIGTAPRASQRTVLGFFAGGLHGPIRPVLLEHWKEKDKDLQVYEYLPRGMSYYDMMKKSKFCLCPSGFEVASPRVVEAIYLECVPVIISDKYSLPFSDVLNWNAFSVQVDVKDITNLKNILTAIPQRHYMKMRKRVQLVQRHFLVSTPPKRFDMFHMLLHSVWLRRMNIRIHGANR